MERSSVELRGRKEPILEPLDDRKPADDDQAGLRKQLDLADRLAILDELAPSAFDAVCIDTHFHPVDVPDAVVAYGIPSSRWSHDGYERPIDAVHPDDQAGLIGLVAVARRVGVAHGSVRFADTDAVTGMHVLDLTDPWGVILFVRGGQSSRFEAMALTPATVRPRRLVQRRDASAVFNWIDENTTLVLGWSLEDLIGKNAADLVHPDDINRAIDAWMEMLGGVTEPVRLRYRDVYGNYRWFEVHNTSYLADPDRNYVESELIDIDAEMLALAKVRDSEIQFAGLAESLPVGLLQFDEHGEVVFANEWILNLTGYSASDITSLSWVEQQGQASMRRLVRTTLEDRTATEFELTITASNGDLRSCRLRLRPLPLSSGRPGAIASVEDITASLNLQDRLRIQALTDPLTQLPNRRALQMWLEDQGPEDGVALLFLDLDQFKIINDALGHDFGDEFLMAVADLILGAVRPNDFVARLGGDEFVVGCLGIARATEAAELASRLLSALDRPLLVDDRPILARCSIGVAMAKPGQEVGELIGDADLAMYEAKRAGGQRFVFYEEDQRRDVERELHQENDIRASLVASDFELYMQPVVELETGRTVLIESLVRWNHPERGLMVPAQFIPTAERTGLIQPLGSWILGEACRCAALFRAAGLSDCVSVNVSPVQLSAPDFTELVRATIAEHRIEPTDLVLEVTETVFLETNEDVLMTISSLVSEGIRVALDDFGTGYSSLNHLRLLPSQIVKIDRSYTADALLNPATAAIIESMVGLADRLGQQLIVEGIETAEQASALKAMGVRYGQGFLFGRPKPAADLLKSKPSSHGRLPALNRYPIGP